MAVDFGWFIWPLFLMLEFRFQAASGKYASVGQQVTLSCEDMIDDQRKCDKTSWHFYGSQTAVTLFEHGQIHKDVIDRLSVTEACSLVIKKVTAEDAGNYVCNQLKSGSGSQVYLYVLKMSERKDNDKVMLSCSVSSPGWCGHTVKWLYEGKNVTKDNKDMTTSTSECSVTLTFPASHLKQKSKHPNLFQCEVTQHTSKKAQLFTFNHWSSGYDGTTTTLSPTIKSKSEKMSTAARTTESASTNNNSGGKQEGLWGFIIVSVGLTALLIIIVAFIRWKKTKGNKTQRDENVADAEDGFFYTSVTYIKNTNRKDRVLDKDDDDDDDAVIYSTVKVSSSSDRCYATVNKPNT